MFLGHDEDFWCASLNYSCTCDVQEIKKNCQNCKHLTSFVWFENPGRKLVKESQMEKPMLKKYPLNDVTEYYEFVWFEDEDKESEETDACTENTVKPLDDMLTDAQNQDPSWLLAYFFNLFV